MPRHYNDRENLWLLKYCKIQSFLLYVFSLILLIFSHLFCIQFLILFLFSQLICIQSHLIYSAKVYIYSVPSYCIQSNLIYIQSTYIYSVLFYIQPRYLYSAPFFLHSVSSYLYSVNLYVFSHMLYLLSSHLFFVNMFNVLWVTLRNLIKICSFLKKSECMSYRTTFHKEIKQTKVLSKRNSFILVVMI